MPKVGTSRLKSSTSGSRVRLPTGTVIDRHAPDAQPGSGLHRRLAFIPITVGGQDDGSQIGDFLRRLGQRLVQVGAVS